MRCAEWPAAIELPNTRHRGTEIVPAAALQVS